MKKVIKVKASVRGGKVVKAHRRNIEVPGAHIPGVAGKEFRSYFTPFISLPSAEDITEWQKHGIDDYEEGPSEAWLRADRFLKAKLPPDDYKRLYNAENTTSADYRDLHRVHVLKLQPIRTPKTGDFAADTKRQIEKLSAEAATLASHKPESYHLKQWYKQKLASLHEDLTSHNAEISAKAGKVPVADRTITTVIKKGKRASNGVQVLPIHNNPEAVQINVRDKDKVHHLVINKRDLEMLKKGKQPDIRTGNVTVHTSDITDKTGKTTLTNTYHQVTADQKAVTTAIKRIKNLI